MALIRRLAKRLSGLISGPQPERPRIPYSENGWDHIPKGEYDYVPKGTHVFGPADRFLLVPKNRYRAVLLPGQERRTELGVGWITEDNSSEGYDLLWGEADNLHEYRIEADSVREKLKVEIVDRIEHRIAADANIVDIGCGVGDLLGEIRRRRPGVRVSGLDFSGKAVENAQRTYPDGAFQQFVIDRTLPYQTASFDVVSCTDVLEHLEYPQSVVAELVRICKPGGLVAIVVPDGTLDQFLGHNWFWNVETFAALLAEWAPQVAPLPVTGELMATIEVPGEGV
ncbi:class I SAM-dependent methyltransferase [Tardiphaga sp. 804_B3_N1_9]|uniref:methyltransferase domain-containing protein n=1 Tax=Tardiphaga TaxID=1395974 RepID=UPI00158601CF|nr:class I SAM-dependent methyltransferase [Tardiphaga robiniae]